MPGRVITEITLSVFIAMIIVANITIIVKCKVYKNLNSMMIMCAITTMQIIRLANYIWRLIADKWCTDYWEWYRLMTDWTNYLLGVIALVLIVQWYQTYSALNNPLNALRTFEKNWAKVAQISLIVIYTVFIVFDSLIVLGDAFTSQKNKKKTRSHFDVVAYHLLEWVQAILNAICLLSYVILFIWFVMLIAKNKDQLRGLLRQVIIFFSIMLVMLSLNFVLDLIFYISFD